MPLGILYYSDSSWHAQLTDLAGSYICDSCPITLGGRPLPSACPLVSTRHVEKEHWQNTQYWDMKGLLDIAPVAREHGIAAEDLVVTAPDISVCQALYLCDQRGFNEFGGLTLHCPDLVDRSRRGAKYLYMIGRKKDLRDRFLDCLGAPLFEHGDVEVYDIRHLAAQ